MPRANSKHHTSVLVYKSNGEKIPDDVYINDSNLNKRYALKKSNGEMVTRYENIAELKEQETLIQVSVLSKGQFGRITRKRKRAEFIDFQQDNKEPAEKRHKKANQSNSDGSDDEFFSVQSPQPEEQDDDLIYDSNQESSDRESFKINIDDKNNHVRKKKRGESRLVYRSNGNSVPDDVYIDKSKPKRKCAFQKANGEMVKIGEDIQQLQNKEELIQIFIVNKRRFDNIQKEKELTDFQQRNYELSKQYKSSSDDSSPEKFSDSKSTSSEEKMDVKDHALTRDNPSELISSFQNQGSFYVSSQTKISGNHSTLFSSTQTKHPHKLGSKLISDWDGPREGTFMSSPEKYKLYQ